MSEKSYYENDDFWTGETQEQDSARFDFIIGQLPDDVEALLDVGCGNGAFLRAVAKQRPNVKLCGTDRSAAALRLATCSYTQASLEALPFRDRSFDVVTCLEVIEHLPVPLYAPALNELARVAKRLILVSVPREQDLSLGQVRCPLCLTCFNPDYHLRSFDPQTMLDLFDRVDFVARRVTAYGNGTEYFGAKIITRLKRAKENRFPQDIPCPACDNVLPGKPNAAVSPVTESNGDLRSTVKAFWPKQRSPRWLLGRYERVGAGPGHDSGPMATSVPAT